MFNNLNNQQQPTSLTPAPIKTIPELLNVVEDLQDPIVESEESLSDLITSMENNYYGRYNLGDIVGAKERIVDTYGNLCRKLLMLSHRNYDVGFTSHLTPVVHGHMHSLEIPKSKKRQEKELFILQQKVTTEYKASIKHQEAARVIKLEAAQKALKAAVADSNDYQARLDKALENL